MINLANLIQARNRWMEQFARSGNPGAQQRVNAFQNRIGGVSANAPPPGGMPHGDPTGEFGVGAQAPSLGGMPYNTGTMAQAPQSQGQPYSTGASAGVPALGGMPFGGGTGIDFASAAQPGAMSQPLNPPPQSGPSAPGMPDLMQLIMQMMQQRMAPQSRNQQPIQTQGFQPLTPQQNQQRNAGQTPTGVMQAPWQIKSQNTGPRNFIQASQPVGMQMMQAPRTGMAPRGGSTALNGNPWSY